MRYEDIVQNMYKCNWHKNFYNVTMVCLFVII